MPMQAFYAEQPIRTESAGQSTERPAEAEKDSGACTQRAGPASEACRHLVSSSCARVLVGEGATSRCNRVQPAVAAWVVCGCL